MTGTVLLIVVAMLSITALNVVALANGINGVLLASGMAIIGGLAGYQGKILRDKKHGQK